MQIKHGVGSIFFFSVNPTKGKINSCMGPFWSIEGEENLFFQQKLFFVFFISELQGEGRGGLTSFSTCHSEGLPPPLLHHHVMLVGFLGLATT